MRYTVHIAFICLFWGCGTGTETTISNNPSVTEGAGQPEAALPPDDAVSVPGTDLSGSIDRKQLTTLNREKLRLLRNEIYARNGHTFRSSELNEYFSKFEWYAPRYTAKEVENLLSVTDKSNIELIRSFEARRKGSWNASLQQYLDMLPVVPLPLDFVCEEGFDVPELKYEEGVVQRHKPEGAAIIGLLYQTPGEALIIYGYSADIFYPIISKIDEKGDEVGEIRLFPLRDCVNDAGYEAKTYGKITEDFQVVTRTVQYTWNPNGSSSEKDSVVAEKTIGLR